MSDTTSRRKRILFVAEAVTLAHVARPAALFGCVDSERFDAFVACDPRSHRFLTMDAGSLHAIRSIDSKVFSERLRHGRPVYGASTLREYVAADLALIARIKPDLIVGDFRLSLSVSARVAGVPYASITNAYWSPFARDRSMPLPVLPWTPFAPIALAQRVFDLMQPLVLARHCRPLNSVRAEHGLQPLPQDLRRVYTDADFVLYADSPALFPIQDAPANHMHLGPVLWSPPVPAPPWWSELPAAQPLAYVTMGSSGSPRLLETIIASLVEMNLAVVASTAGAPIPRHEWHNVWFAEYLPGEKAAAKAALVICNGGSPTTQQALAAGAAVIGLCENMDQMLNMRGLVASGAGVAFRVDRMTPQNLVNAVQTLLAQRGGTGGTRPARLTTPDFRARFPQFLDDVLSSQEATDNPTASQT